MSGEPPSEDAPALWSAAAQSGQILLRLLGLLLVHTGALAVAPAAARVAADPHALKRQVVGRQVAVGVAKAAKLARALGALAA